jgi:hypothetical protein
VGGEIGVNPVFAMEIVLLAAAALLSAGLYAQWRTSASCDRRIRAYLLVLRAGAVAVLVALALDVGRWRRSAETGEREWVILADRSASMGTADIERRSRWDAAMAMAVEAMAGADDAGRLRIVPFDTGIGEAIGDPAKAGRELSGRGTDLNRAMHELLDRYQGGGRELAGVAILSDGRQTSIRPPVDAARRAVARGIGVTAVPLGGEVPRHDLQVRAVRGQLVAHKGQRLKILGRVDNRNMGDVRAAVRLLGADGKATAETTIDVTNNTSVEVVFTAVPTNSGRTEYRLDAPVWPGEALTRNNSERVAVSVLEQPVRVLLVEGTPYWDSKFLAQLLRLQTNIAISALYRVSSERSMRIDSGGARPAGRADEAFPSDAASLAAYDLLVFGKGAEYFLDAPRVALVKAFLREQGGAVIFSRGKPYHGNTFPEMESIEPVEWGESLGADFRWVPTTDGEAAGLFDGFLPGRDDPVWGRLPPMRSANGCRRVKAFATVLVEGRAAAAGGAEGGFPVVVAMRHGRGVVAAVNGEGLWQWDFFAAPEAKALYEDFWMQLMQWAVAYSDFLPGYSYALRATSRSAAPGEPVRIRVARRGEQEEAPPKEVAVTGPSGRQALALVAVAGQDDRWETVLAAERPGVYSVTVAGADGKPLAPAEEIEVVPPPGETEECSADLEYLGRFAAEAGGRVLPQSSWKEWIAALAVPAAVKVQADATWESRWDRAWVLILLAGLLGCEWFIRRRNGLA